MGNEIFLQNYSRVHPQIKKTYSNQKKHYSQKVGIGRKLIRYGQKNILEEYFRPIPTNSDLSKILFFGQNKFDFFFGDVAYMTLEFQ